MADRQHVYRCSDGHDTEETVIEMPFGQSPDKHPDCQKCGKRMGKVFGKPLIAYEMAWHHSQKNTDWG